MKNILITSAAAAALTLTGGAFAAPKGGGGVKIGGSAKVGAGPQMTAPRGVGPAVSGAARTRGGASVVLPETRASEKGVARGSASATMGARAADDDDLAVNAVGKGKVKAWADDDDDDNDGILDVSDPDDDNDGILDGVDDDDLTWTNNGVGAAVSAAARTGGGAAAILPNTRASETGVAQGSMSATNSGRDTSATVRGKGKARGRLDTDGDGIPDNRDIDANNNGVLDINE